MLDPTQPVQQTTPPKPTSVAQPNRVLNVEMSTAPVLKYFAASEPRRVGY